MFTIADKRILITGASQGLGAVCAKRFSELGAKLALVARSADKLKEVCADCKSPERHLIIPTDLTDTEKLYRCFLKTKAFLRDIDVVLHVVGGGLGFSDDLLNAVDFQRLFILNVIVAAEMNRLVIPDMLKRKKGNLVHVASIAASEAVASVGYNTVKAALAAYVRSLGNKLIGSGVIVTGILPGGFYAPGNAWERLKSQNPKIVKKFIDERLPRKRLADAKELVPLITFLCSDTASMMGGCLVPIDAGEGKSYVRT